MNCPNCGKEVKETDKFCPECGALVQNDGTSQDTINAEVVHTSTTYTNTAQEGEQNGLSITSLVLGIASFVCIAINTFLTILCAILAIIFGAIGRKKGAKGIGTAGLVLGIIALVIEVIIIIFAMMLVFHVAGSLVY